MWARSSRRSLVLVAAAACGHSPGGDPAAVRTRAALMTRNVPAPGAVRDCTPADLTGVPSMTFRSLALLAGDALSARPEDAAWINPSGLDAPSVRTLLAGADRSAAAVLLDARAWVVYKVDLVNAPMALGVKELKIGTVHTRVVRYEASGAPSCVLVFNFQNDPAVSDKAIEVSDKPQLDPAVTSLLRDDLSAQYVKLAPRGA